MKGRNYPDLLPTFHIRAFYKSFPCNSPFRDYQPYCHLSPHSPRRARRLFLRVSLALSAIRNFR